MKNEGSVDRLVRFLLGISLVIYSYFWIGGWVEILVIILGIVLLATSLMGFCGLYKLFGMNTTGWNIKPLILWPLVIVVLLGASGAAYASAFFSKITFLEDFNSMNLAYKDALFTTGNAPEQSKKAYDQFVIAFDEFRNKYQAYRPWVIKSDSAFSESLAGTQKDMLSAKPLVESGDAQGAHIALEGIRLKLNEILRRNNLSPFTVALVDFHDSMEILVEAADSEDASSILKYFPATDKKLQDVETLGNDAGIQKIRASLNALRSLAQSGDSKKLPSAGKALKTSYVSIYHTQ